MNLSHLLIAVVLGVGTISCQMTTNSESRTGSLESESQTTGLEGRTMIASPCPGPVREDQPCPDQPVRAAFEVLDAQNKVVAHFQSDADGHFKVALKPGVYTIVPGPEAPIFNARIQRKTVTVQAQQMTQVTLRFDSGMR